MAMSYFKTIKELVIYNKERTGKYIFWGSNVTKNPRKMSHSSYWGSTEAIWGWVSQSSLHPHHTPTRMHNIPEPGECAISCLNILYDLSGLTHSWTSRQLVSSLHLWESNIPNSYESSRKTQNPSKLMLNPDSSFLQDCISVCSLTQHQASFVGICSVFSAIYPQSDTKNAEGKNQDCEGWKKKM